jgi:hypothetical protein
MQWRLEPLDSTASPGALEAFNYEGSCLQPGFTKRPNSLYGSSRSLADSGAPW